MDNSETERVSERYTRRATLGSDDRYSMLNPSVWKGVQERQRVIIGLLARYPKKPLNELSLLEIGCGNGANLLELLRMGFAPENLVANELLSERVAAARKNLPEAIALHEGDATKLAFGTGSFDIILQSTVFTSLLDDDFQTLLAKQMWRWVRPGGGILWYDFTYDNPNNPDVRGMPLKRIKELFPQAKVDARRVTLAPPISRRVCKLHSNLYNILNTLPFLRTHLVCWIGKF